MNKVTRFIHHHRRVRHAVYQTDTNIRRSVIRSALLLLGFAAVHVTAMVWLEDMALWHAIWLTMTTLTTVGYGDVTPVTAMGKIIAALAAISGVDVLAFLTGIVATAFAAHMDQKKQFFEAQLR